jgi:ribosome-binding factor A
MTADKRKRERLLARCGQLHEDDGVDPRQFLKTDNRRDHGHFKTRQLCRQVAETLALVLAGRFGDDRLHSLQVASVHPAPNAAQLLVTLRTDEPCDRGETQEILDRLGAVSGRLRSEVAAAISRKRTPKLLFCVLGPAVPEEVRE